MCCFLFYLSVVFVSPETVLLAEWKALLSDSVMKRKIQDEFLWDLLRAELRPHLPAAGLGGVRGRHPLAGADLRGDRHPHCHRAAAEDHLLPSAPELPENVE